MYILNLKTIIKYTKFHNMSCISGRKGGKRSEPAALCFVFNV